MTKFKIGANKKKRYEIIKGRIIKEYPDFYLLKTIAGYKECINKNCLKCGDVMRL